MFQLVLLLCQVIIILTPTRASTTVDGSDYDPDYPTTTNPSLMSLFLKNILNLGLGSLRDGKDQLKPTPAEPKTKTCDKNIIRAFIDAKVKELGPFLQDNEYIESDQEDNLTLVGGDETTIVELVSDDKNVLRQRDPFKDNVKKYKRLRKRIHKALLKESVTDTTVNLIIQTIDEMIAKMLASRCSRSGDRGSALRSGDRKIEDIVRRPAAWKLEWQKIREKYSDLFHGNNSVPQERLNVIVGSLMEKLPSFFANVLRDGESLAKGYNIRCQKMTESEVVETTSSPKRSRLFAHNISSPDAQVCKSKIWICSGELNRFLISLFKYVNTSTAKVLNDYLEMYKIDVNIDKVFGHKGIVSTLKEINEEAENEVCKIYAKKIQSLIINKGKKYDLYKMDLIHLIKNITESVKMHTNQIIRVKMEPVDTELKERILKDLDDNMKVELERLADELETTICPAFETCNGKYTVKSSNRAFGDHSSVFVRVQVKLDDDLKYDLFNDRTVQPAESKDGKFIEMPLKITNTTFTINKNNNLKFLSVTRTTRSYSEKSDTKIN